MATVSASPADGTAESEESLADGGYFGGEELSKTVDRGYEVSLNLPKYIKGDGGNKYHKSNFIYNREKDVYICPEGSELFFYYEKPGSGKNYRVRIYRCVNESARLCLRLPLSFHFLNNRGCLSRILLAALKQ
ncbi:MAG: hypothetical protein QG657_1528 [Acidobacteriota bacterium]|nr:hypothetical protein [Acidobacteriota bacterium]